MLQNDYNDHNAGVMNNEYAKNRGKRTELVFRYKCRAAIAAEAVTAHFQKTSDLNILDLGSADGRAMLELRSLLNPRSLTGIELSDDIPSFIPESIEDTQIIKGDITNLPPQVMSRTYDVVTALAVLEHLPDPLATLKAASGVLSRNGLFIATCPVPFWDKISTSAGLLKDSHHEDQLGESALKSLAVTAGLTVESFNRFMWAPIAVIPYLRIPVPVKASLRIDALLRKIPPFKPLFVNQCLVARKNQ